MLKNRSYINPCFNISITCRYFRLCLLFMVCSHTFYGQAKSEDDLKKEALKSFENEDYAQAYKFYAQLVSLYPKDPDYNYHLGVCMLYTEPDKKKPFSYLQIAVNNPKDAPKDAKFYLAKAYHYNYRFDDAIRLYTEYKQTASASSIKKLQVDREIENCRNGKKLLSNLSDLVIIEKKQLNEADYFRSYNLSDIGGKLLVKPDDFKTATDKKKKDNSVIYLPRNNERIYYSSYGENGDQGRDIYFVNKLPNGSWSKPQPLPSTINTPYDEDYPFLHPNGHTLYFSSKGHNSMGGYDIFKTTLDDQTNTWSKPVNLDFPINSPDDDILFVTDSLEKTAYFSSGRYSPNGKIDVMKINTERRPMDIAVLKGTVVKEDIGQSVKSKITVKNIANGEIVGTYQAQDNGDYYMELPNGGKFIFTVETPGIPTQSDGVQMPVAYSLKPYKQVISYDNKVLKIINYFDGQVSDDNYSMYIDLIEKKAKLEVNENEPYNNNLVKNQPDNASANTGNNNPQAVSTNNPTVVDQGTGSNPAATKNNKNISNDQLLSLAKEDLKEATEEAKQLKQQAQDAMSLSTQKNQEAADLQKQADEASSKANAITDVNTKNEELAKANDLKEQAHIASNVANTASNLAKKLEVDANLQQKEADVSTQYVKELEAVTKNKNNKEALAKLDELQKQLDDLSKQKNQSDELFNALKAEAELKQNELKKEEQKNVTASNDVNALKAEVKDLEKDLANEKDNSLKENINAQIREINADIDTKNKEIAGNEQKISQLKNEAEAVTKELEIAAKILNEKTDLVAGNNPSESSFDGAVTTNTTSSGDNNTNANNAGDGSKAATYEDLSAKYADQAKPIDKNNNPTVTDLEKQNDILTAYNKEIAALVSLDKTAAGKAKTSDEKKKINEEIKKLEKQKTENDKLIALNKTREKQVGTAIAANSNTTSAGNNNDGGTAIETSTTSTAATATNDAAAIASETESPNAVNNNTTTIANNAAGTNTNTPLNAISTSEGANNAGYLAALSDLKNNLGQNTGSAKELFAYNQYKETSSVAMKQEAVAKYETAKQQEDALTKLVNAAENSIRNSSGSNPTLLTNESETLNNEALELRKQSATKTGAEKNTLLVKAVELEKQAVEKKLKAAEITATLNKEKIANNQANIDALLKLNGNKTNGEISQADMLATEAQINDKQAQKIRQEAGAYPSSASKLGGYGNAEEKENEVLLKQEKAIELLQKNNPSYQPLKMADAGNPTSIIAGVNAEINKTSQSQANAYAALSKANQNELKLHGDKLSKKPAFVGNSTARDLKTKSDGYNKDAIALINKANSATNSAEKSNLFLQANQKELEALKALHQASDAISSNVVADNNNSPANNNTGNNIGQNNNAANATSTNGNNTGQNNNTTATNSNTVSATHNDNATAGNQGDNNTGNPTNTNNGNSGDNTTTTATSATNSNTTAIATNTTNTTTDTGTLTANNNDGNNDTQDNGAGSQTDKLKTALNSDGENYLTAFARYTNSDALSLKEKALEKINAALNEDKTLSTKLNEIVTTNNTNNNNGPAPANLNSEADGLNDQAAVLRKKADIASGDEKKDLLAQATALESKAVDKKIEASAMQKDINAATLDANAESLRDLAQLSKGKNISERSAIQSMISDAETARKKAKNLREEANNYPTNAAKLGGYNNAEEKEAEAIAWQQKAIELYKKYVPAYKAKQPGLVQGNSDAASKLNELEASVDSNVLQHNDGLSLLTQANEKEYKSRFMALPANLNPSQQTSKTKAQAAYKQSQALLAQANQATNPVKKKNLLVESNKKGQEAINELSSISSDNTAANNNRPENNNGNPANATDTTNNNNATAANTNAGNDTGATTNSTAGNTGNRINNTTGGNNNTTGTDAGATTNPVTNNNGNRTNDTNNNTNPANNNAGNNNNAGANVVKLKVNGVEVKKTNAYSVTKPIPIDEKIQDGLVFKVQIGAFKNPIPNEQFKGLSPVIGQTTPNGYIRYMAGNFEQYDGANAVKNDLHRLGYNDAFVVAYYNGQRITLSEAIAKLQAAGQNVGLSANTSAGISDNNNIPRNVAPANNNANNTATANNNTTTDAAPVEVTKELEQVNGLLYTVQIGVFSKQVTRGQLYNLRPIYTERLPNGLYRYTAGIYNQTGKLTEDKRKVVDLGVRDAFVSAYYNAKRIPFADAQKLQAENNNLKLETENPIIFPNAASLTPPNNNTAVTNPATTERTTPVNTNTPAVAPFTNGVTKAPEPTAENGVKTGEEGISFKVQIGAYKNQIPNDVAARFLNIKTWPVDNKVVNGLYIYTIGNFVGTAFAKKLKDEAISVGITDAFITVYKDGKKLYGQEASQYLGR